MAHRSAPCFLSGTLAHYHGSMTSRHGTVTIVGLDAEKPGRIIVRCGDGEILKHCRPESVTLLAHGALGLRLTAN